MPPGATLFAGLQLGIERKKYNKLKNIAFYFSLSQWARFELECVRRSRALTLALKFLSPPKVLHVLLPSCMLDGEIGVCGK